VRLRSSNRSTRRTCGWFALAGVVLPIFAMVGDWTGNNGSGRQGDAVIWIPIIAICAVTFVVTLVADRLSLVVSETLRA
jgi:hypothetical protein